MCNSAGACGSRKPGPGGQRRVNATAPMAGPWGWKGCRINRLACGNPTQRFMSALQLLWSAGARAHQGRSIHLLDDGGTAGCHGQNTHPQKPPRHPPCPAAPSRPAALPELGAQPACSASHAARSAAHQTLLDAALERGPVHPIRCKQPGAPARPARAENRHHR